MDSFELNKVAGAVLGTLLFAFGTGFVAELIYHPKPAGQAGYALPEPSAEKASGGDTAAPKADSIAVRLASADVEKGKAGTKACAACHNFEKDGPNKIGPALWDVVERQKGSHAGFDYSAGLKEKGGAWTYEDLDHFLENPKGYIKGTKMAFQGIGDAKQRADVVLYLHSLSDSPKPLPAADKKDGAKADGEADRKAVGKAEGGAAGGADAITTKVASADPAKGKDGTKACAACHNFEKDGPNKIGPALWGVVGRKKGSHEGFDYSAAIKEKGGAWTVADLNAFLTKPADYAKGTKMAFQGIAQEDKRAEVIAYLATLSDNPKPVQGGEKKDEKKSEGAKPDEKAAAAPAQADKKADGVTPAQGETADTDRPGGSGKAQSQMPSGENPPEAKPAASEQTAPKASEETPAKTEAPAQANPEAEKKAEEMKDGSGEQKAQ